MIGFEPFGGSGILRASKIVAASDQFGELGAGTTATIQISAGDIAIGVVGKGCSVAINAPFVGPGLSSLLLSIGPAFDPTALLAGYEVAGAAMAGAAINVDDIGGNSMAVIGYGGPLFATFTATGADINTIIGGEVQIVCDAALPGVL